VSKRRSTSNLHKIRQRSGFRNQKGVIIISCREHSKSPRPRTPELSASYLPRQHILILHDLPFLLGSTPVMVKTSCFAIQLAREAA